MTIEFTPNEARVIGCLIEKEITTPEQYPLWLNALTNACNQKSNRDPVLDLDETTVQQTLDQLIKKYLVSEESGYGSRVAKYRHRFCNTEYGNLKFTPQELGIVCELLLRGPQTPGNCAVGPVACAQSRMSRQWKRHLMRWPDARMARMLFVCRGNRASENHVMPIFSAAKSMGARQPSVKIFLRSNPRNRHNSSSGLPNSRPKSRNSKPC